MHDTSDRTHGTLRQTSNDCSTTPHTARNQISCLLGLNSAPHAQAPSALERPFNQQTNSQLHLNQQQPTQAQISDRQGNQIPVLPFNSPMPREGPLGLDQRAAQQGRVAQCAPLELGLCNLSSIDVLVAPPLNLRGSPLSRTHELKLCPPATRSFNSHSDTTPNSTTPTSYMGICFEAKVENPVGLHLAGMGGKSNCSRPARINDDLTIFAPSPSCQYFGTSSATAPSSMVFFHSSHCDDLNLATSTRHGSGSGFSPSAGTSGWNPWLPLGSSQPGEYIDAAGEHIDKFLCYDRFSSSDGLMTPSGSFDRGTLMLPSPQGTGLLPFSARGIHLPLPTPRADSQSPQNLDGES
jgi:hypothetical protein